MKKKILVFKICILVLIGSNQYAYSQCPSGQSQIIVDVIPNDYPWSMENTWDIKDDQNNIIVSGTSGRDTFCYDSNKLLTFNIYDPSLDGLGPGSYHIYKDGLEIESIDPWVPFGPVKTVVFNYPVGQKGDMLANVCKELRDHCNGIKLLSPAQINAHSTTITENRSYLGDNLSVITEAFNLIDCYDSKYGALFVDGKTIPNTPGALDGLEFKRAVFTLMQNLFNVLYTTPKTKEFSAFLNGKKYLTSNYFPGSCPLPKDPNKEYVVKINASKLADWGIPTGSSLAEVKRPTGYYLSAGTIGKVKVPQVMVNRGYKILIGAHPELKNKSVANRFLNVQSTYNITDTLTQIANPFGGGIYILVPNLSSGGFQDIKLSNVVPAPFFSANTDNKTTLSEWQNVQRKNLAPWTDFESEKFMLTIPTSFIYNYNDPVSLMDMWNKRMDAVTDFLGYPNIRNCHTLYLSIDLDILYGAFGSGYPSVNYTFSPFDPQNGNSDIWFLSTNPLRMWDTEFHELGHAMFRTNFPGEEEALVNFLHAVVMNQVHGMSIDSAFGMSNSNMYHVNRDRAAIDWMVKRNFRMGKPMDISGATTNEVRYQHRGYAKYAEIAALFGMEVFNKFHNQQNIDYNNGTTLYALNDVDSRILRLSIAANADLRPLIHFGGVQPIDSAALAKEIIKNKLQPSSLICQRLGHYKTIVPMDSAQFNQHAEIFLNGPVTQGESPDYWNGWYFDWVPKYKKTHGDSAVAAIDNIIQTYFPNGCPVAGIENNDINNSNVIIYPNPNTGVFTISIQENEAEINITNLLGQQIMNKKTNQKSTNVEIKNNGVYLINIKTKLGNEVKKVVVNEN